MKKHLLLLLVLLSLSFSVYAQSPKKISYQAVARDAQGLPVGGQTINVQFNILKGSPSGGGVYSENHSGTPTNEFGLFNVQIGNGSNASGSLAAVDWSDGPYFLSVGIDMNNGSNFQNVGVTELLSVPYALHAQTVDQAAFANWDQNVNDDFSGDYSDLRGAPWFDNANGINTFDNVGIGNNNPSEKLDVNGNIEVSGSYKFASPRTDYYHVGCSEFIARNNNSGSWSLHGDQEYGSFSEISGSWRAFATVHLPHGAIVQEVRVYYVDASAKNMTVYFRRTSSNGLSIENLGSATSSEIDSPNQPFARQMAFNLNTTINNANNRYTLIFESTENSNNHRLYNVRIKYTIDKL